MLQSLQPYMKQEKLLFEIRKNLPSAKYPQTPSLDGMYQDKYLLDGETTEGNINKPVRKNIFIEIIKLIVSLFKK